MLSSFDSMLIGAVLPVNIVNINSLSLGKEDGGPWGIWDFRARGQNEPPTDYSSLFTLPLPLWKSQACVLSKVRFILLIVFFKLVWNHLCQFIQNRHLEQIWNKKHSSWELFAGLLTTFGKNRNTTQQWAEFQMICMLGFCGRIECIPGAGEKLKLWPFGLKLLQKPHLALPFFFFFFLPTVWNYYLIAVCPDHYLYHKASSRMSFFPQMAVAAPSTIPVLTSARLGT